MSRQMRLPFQKPTRRSGTLSRRRFLHGAGAVSIALPYLSSTKERSAWAADEPRFAFFISAQNGVVADTFWPNELGPLTNLADDPNAAGELGEFADQLLFIRGVTYPAGLTGCGHAQSCSMMFTGAPSEGSTNKAVSTAPSIDTILAPYLNPDGSEPLALYAGPKGGYINERISFIEAGQVRPAESNPYQAYQDLLTRFMPTEEQMGAAALDELTARRKSAVDLVRDELLAFQGRSGISVADKQRLDVHLQSLRDIELDLADVMGSGCTLDSLDVASIEAANEVFKDRTKVEEMARLQMQIAAFSFACNINNVATLQCGDGEDDSIYLVPSNVDRRWTFHWIQNRIQSDGSSGNDAMAAAAHAEIDRWKMQSLNYCLQQLDKHQLLDKGVVMWANQMGEGHPHSFRDLPIILAGNPGGVLQSGQHLEADPSSTTVQNGRVLTSVAKAVGVDVVIGTDEAGALPSLFA